MDLSLNHNAGLQYWPVFFFRDIKANFGKRLPEVLAPVALDDATPSTTDFELLRPLPYEPIPPDAGDSNRGYHNDLTNQFNEHPRLREVHGKARPKAPSNLLRRMFDKTRAGRWSRARRMCRESNLRPSRTEEDRVNCPFYFKIGACRNGDQCNRLHNRPTMSQTLLLSHMYPNTPESLALANDEPWDDDMYDRAQAHLEAFYVEVFLELANYGEIEDLVVVDNLCDHMIGNVYVAGRMLGQCWRPKKRRIGHGI
eukprot:s337_g13.t1